MHVSDLEQVESFNILWVEVEEEFRRLYTPFANCSSEADRNHTIAQVVQFYVASVLYVYK